MVVMIDRFIDENFVEPKDKILVFNQLTECIEVSAKINDVEVVSILWNEDFQIELVKIWKKF